MLTLFETYGIHMQAVEKCLSAIPNQKVENVRNVLKSLQEKGTTPEEMGCYLRTILNGSGQDLNGTLNRLHDHHVSMQAGLSMIGKRGTGHEQVGNFIEMMEKHNLQKETAINQRGKTSQTQDNRWALALARQDPEALDNLFTQATKMGLKQELLENSARIFDKRNPYEVTKLLELFITYRISKEQAQRCLLILPANQTVEEINNILIAIAKHPIPQEAVENILPELLTKGNAEDIDAVLKTLFEHKMPQTTIAYYLREFLLVRPKEVVQIYKVLDGEKIDPEVVARNPFVLLKGNANRMSRIFQVLRKHHINGKATENCLSLLRRRKPSSNGPAINHIRKTPNSTRGNSELLIHFDLCTTKENGKKIGNSRGI